MFRALAILASTATFAAAQPEEQRISVVLDTTEAIAALAIMDALNAGREANAVQTGALRSSRPYVRLRERENAVQRPFTDEEFVAHLKSPAVRVQAPALRLALSRWTKPEIDSAARRAFAYLPAGSTLRASIFPMIKIKPNTFVFDIKTNPAIFYAINPAEPPEKFANTLAHEMHHIGLGQNCTVADLPGTPGVVAMRRWVGAFGEGLAMLAAAGSIETHPHHDSSASERAVWDAETAKFAQYQAQQDAYFRSVVAGTAGGEGAVTEAMFGYFGEAQGPWYSVGWRMAVTIEQELGRAAVIDAFCRPHTLLATFNRAADLNAQRTGVRLPKWDAALAQAIAG